MRASRLFSAWIYGFALGVGWISTGLAEDQGSQMVLPSDVTATPIPSFALPSDVVDGTPVPYPLSSDPQTGNLVGTSTVDTRTSPANALPNTTDNQFLTYIDRLDTPISACQYYKAIGAVKDCDMQTGKFKEPLVDFDTWRKMVRIDQHTASGFKTDVAHFINQVDLNLTRDHHMVYYGPKQVAAYVCNHKPPAASAADPSGYFPSQTEINAAIAGIRHNTNVIACVAMEFSADLSIDPTNANPAGTPFTKFWIFGPPNEGGKLLSTVDLDGRGPKGVPNVCTACHGGPFDTNNAAGQFDPTLYKTTGRVQGDVGAHFLPFDMANFAFARNPKLTKAEQDAVAAQQEDAIFKLNRNVYDLENPLWHVDQQKTLSNGQPNPNFGLIALGTRAAASIAELIQGWYGNVTASNPTPSFNTNWVPPQWDFDAPNGPYQQAYLNAISHNCRTCHVAMEKYPFEVDRTFAVASQSQVCAQHVMPNSKVTFDRFWLSGQVIPPVPGQPTKDLHQAEALFNLYNAVSPQVDLTNCKQP